MTKVKSTEGRTLCPVLPPGPVVMAQLPVLTQGSNGFQSIHARFTPSL